MATELVTFKIESKFLEEIDDLVKEENYQNRTELIRDTLRKKLDEKEKMKLLAHLKSLKGSVKKKVSENEYERGREEAAKEIMGMSEQEQQAFMEKFFRE